MRKIALFRISREYPKVKVNGVSKFDLFNNIQSTFLDWEFICVADNCDQPLLDRLYSEYLFDQIIETKLGNPSSFWKLYELRNSTQEYDITYFINDDCLHSPGSPEAILEGFQCFDSLYYRPDKYTRSTCAINPYAKSNWFFKTSELALDDRQIWRTLNATTMTFAVTDKTLREDSDIWSMTKTEQRNFDFDLFLRLRQAARPT